MEATTVRAIGPMRRANMLLYWRNNQLPRWAEDEEAKPEHPRWKSRAVRQRVYMLRTFAVTLLLVVLIITFRSAPGAAAQPGHLELMRLQGRATDVARILRTSTQYTPVQQPLREHAATFEPGEDFLEDLPIAPEGADAGSKSLQSTQLEAPDDAAQPANGTSSPERKPTPAVVRGHSLSPVDRAQLLPEIVFIPFEDAVTDETLEGWEDDWFSEVHYDESQSGLLQEPSIDFIYLWVNGSDERFSKSKYVYELNSTLNDPEGVWIAHHSTNRYRDWDELRYSIRSLEKYTGPWRNTIQLLVNSVPNEDGKLERQTPTWLNNHAKTRKDVKVISQEELFDEDKQSCLPTFNSLTIENQVFNINSTSDHLFTLSDDMLLGKPHAASDFYSPLYGPTFGFKSNTYNTRNAPTDADAARFGEKPYLIYTSWLLNRRFGQRKRKGQMHFGHSLRRSVMREALSSFPRPEMESVCQRFRGEDKFQIYSWNVAFHYTIERQREVLLWSYLLHRADPDGDGNLDQAERDQVLLDLEAGMANEGLSAYRQRNFYHLASHLEAAGLEPPRLSTEVLWTSLDGPMAIHDLECSQFDVDECLAPGFGAHTYEPADSGIGAPRTRNPAFSTAAIFERIARSQPECGDCFLKLLLNQQPKGLGPLLPDKENQATARELVLKALKRYQYTVVDHDALFYMITDAEQVESTLLKRFAKPERRVGQLCLNDDVASESADDLADVRRVIEKLYRLLLPEKSSYEL